MIRIDGQPACDPPCDDQPRLIDEGGGARTLLMCADDDRLRGDLYRAVRKHFKGFGRSSDIQPTGMSLTYTGHHMTIARSDHAFASVSMHFHGSRTDKPITFHLERMSPYQDLLTMPGVPAGSVEYIAETIVRAFLRASH